VARPLNVVMVTLVVLVIVVLVGAYQYRSIEESKWITAMEGKDLADALASNWSKNATLIGVRLASGYEKNGCSKAWFYDYVNSSSIITGTADIIEIMVYYNKTAFVTGYFKQNTTYETIYPIRNWSIDSDEAYEIARNNDEIRRFLSNDPAVYVFSLHGSDSSPKWFIEWTYDAGFDNPRWASITIDATTGEVLHVEADLSGFSLRNVCVGFSVVFLVVVAVAVFLAERKKHWGRKRTNIEEEMLGEEKEERDVGHGR